MDESRGRPTIALIVKSLANEFFLTMENGARQHQKAHSNEYQLLTNGIKDEIDVGKQIDLVEQMISQRVDAIVIAPADSKALVAACRKAIDSGIVVVNIDNRFDAQVLAERKLRIPFVGPDNRKGARLAAEYLAQKLNKNDKVAILEGVQGAINGIQRKAGFDDAIAATGLRLVSSQSADWDTDKANQLALAILGEHPDLKAFLCTNDNMALGAIAALKSAEKANQTLVIGFDNISAVHQLIREQRIVATVDQHGDKLAVYGIEYALEMLKNRTPPADRETPVDLITAENVD